MPNAPLAVPNRTAPPLPAWPEDQFDAAMRGLTGERPAGMVRLGREGLPMAQDVRWPADGGRITQLRTTAWEGATALSFDFRLNEALNVWLQPRDELLLTFYLGGQVRGHIGPQPGRPLDFRPGRALLRTPNSPGGYLIEIPGGCRNAFVQFRLKQQLLAQWLRGFGVQLTAREVQRVHLDDGTVLCNAALTPRIRACLARMELDDAPTPSAALALFQGRALELLTCTLLDLPNLLRRARSEIGPGAFQAARDCLLERIAHDWTVAELATRAGCTPAALQRAFLDAVGQPVHQYLRAARLDVAARLLIDTSLDVQQVASEVGWRCHSRFGAAFRGHHGVTPSEYRRRASPPAPDLPGLPLGRP